MKTHQLKTWSEPFGAVWDFYCHKSGVPVGMASSEVRRQFRGALADVSQRDAWLSDHPVQLEWYGGQFDAVEVDPQLPAFAALQSAHADEFGVNPELEGALRHLLHKGA